MAVDGKLPQREVTDFSSKPNFNTQATQSMDVDMEDFGESRVHSDQPRIAVINRKPRRRIEPEEA
jgi:hypothetical protein